MRHAMEHSNGNAGVYGTLAATILFFINIFSISEWAGVMAIFAGATTGAYNLYKFYNDLKKRNKDNNLKT